ncbi:MAG: tyrosine-type recombinase/integrase [Chthonomonadales bacterium]|nr:tyrosine-type recombinase/integrase [Chthonomonadales bacterium]
MKNCQSASQVQIPAALVRDSLLRAVQGWLLSGEIAGWSRKTLDDRCIWMGRLRQYLDANDLAFDVNGLRAYFAAYQKGRDGRSVRPPKPASVKHVHSLVSAFGSWCVQEELLEANPMKRIPAPIIRDDGIEPYTDAELNALLRAAANCQKNGLRNTAILHFLADTAVRASELCAMTVDDVNFTDRTAHVRCGKGGKARIVAFGKTTANVLSRYLLNTARDPEDPLFMSERGGPMTPGSLFQLCKRLGKAAGVRGVHPHRFRHDAAVRLLRNGAHAFGVMSLLGHTRIQTTQVYVKLAEADVKDMHRTASPMDNLNKKGR